VPKIKGIDLELAGAVYTVPPLALGDLELLQERLAVLNVAAVDKASIATVIDATFASLRRNYPDMTREQCAALIDLENMQDVIDSVMDVSGTKRKAIDAKKAEAAGAAAAS
jgi:hypothetical protein